MGQADFLVEGAFIFDAMYQNCVVGASHGGNWLAISKRWFYSKMESESPQRVKKDLMVFYTSKYADFCQ